MNLKSAIKPNFKKMSISKASRLLSQQVWCWGRDIDRAEGNWLNETGFKITKSPPYRRNCDNIYTFDLPNHKYIMLRAFGVLYGVHEGEGIFMPRYDFSPKYSRYLAFDRPPWEEKDLPKLSFPNKSDLDRCAALLFEATKWIRKYEENVIEKLGLNYRRFTLYEWKKIKGKIILAEEMVSEWKLLEKQISRDSPLIVVNDQ